ncbi:MAG: nickel pincer cofactor biosynthesis protein LarB [Thermodesulfobacteriota bacterium]
MDEEQLRTLLDGVRQGSCGVDQALARLRHWPDQELAGACLDHQRQLRTGRPEAVYGEHKSVAQLLEILSALLAAGGPVIATRVSDDKAAQVCQALPGLIHHPQARMLTGPPPPPAPCRGPVLVVSAGTSDQPVAEEAAVTLAMLGQPVERLADVGIAGIHRLYRRQEQLLAAQVLIVVAGMEGALPGVVAGLVDRPVVAVPTSVGYGTGSGGLAALLGMLNSCAPGLAVVNIDNGFGAACMAAAINRP